jgi:CRISPR-associated protein Csm2
MMKTISDLKRQLNQAGRLSTLLKPDEFAGDDQVAAYIAQHYKDDLKPNQTRRIFHTFKKIDRKTRREKGEAVLSQEDRTRLTLLAPEMAYAVGRELIPRDFYDVLSLCLQKDKLKTVKDLRRLVQFLSAILAYQKFYD